MDTFVFTTMKQFISIICLFLFFCIKMNAQQPHFVYLQTDNNQPFYVLLKGKNYSSSSIGYVILPKLENGNYLIKVGFAKNDMPEQDYLLEINDHDQGYLIKNFGEKGSGIFNLQSLAIQYSGESGRQLDAVANAQRETEKQKRIIQQQKDSTEKAELALAEQRRIDNEAKLAAAAAKQKEDATAFEKQRIIDSAKAESEAKTAATNRKKNAIALAKQQGLDSTKNINANRVAAAKKKREAIALANQLRIDSIKNVHADKIALAKQQALAKHEADSMAALTNLLVKEQAKTETLAQKKVRLAKEAVLKKQVDAQAKIEEQKKQETLIVRNKALENIQRVTDSLKTVEKNRLEAEQIAAAEQQKKDEVAVAKQQAEEQTKAEEQKRQDAMIKQKKAVDNVRRTDSINAAEKNKLEVEQDVVKPEKNDSSLLIATPNTQQSSRTANATIVYEPKVLNRTTTDSGTIITYKIPSSKGWDTVAAFIKEPAAEKEKAAIPVEQKIAVENPAPTLPSDGVKFLDIHFKQDSANKANDLITPVFKDDKPVQKTTPSANIPKNIPAKSNSTPNNTSGVATIPIANSNCKAEANDKDFYALRKKMVAQNDADNMIMTAKKSMREKCYSTAQIRNLSVLLITDGERYQFLEAAYPFTSDAYNFGSLADLLKDNYYGERFRVMLKR